MKVTKGTIARTAILVLTIINSGLAIFGKSPLPISDETVTQDCIVWIFHCGRTDCMVERTTASQFPR